MQKASSFRCLAVGRQLRVRISSGRGGPACENGPVTMN